MLSTMYSKVEVGGAQTASIAPLLRGRSILAQASTGISKSPETCSTDVFLLGLCQAVLLWRARFHKMILRSEPQSLVVQSFPIEDGSWELFFTYRLIQIGQWNEHNYSKLLHRFWSHKKSKPLMSIMFSPSPSRHKGTPNSGGCSRMLKRLWKRLEVDVKTSSSHGREEEAAVAAVVLRKKYIKIGLMMLVLDQSFFGTSGGFFSAKMNSRVI